MDLFEFLDLVFSFLDLGSWRFYLCLLGGVLLALLLFGGIATEWLRNALAGTIVLASIVVRLRWESRA
jgi:hypothetical protein